MQGERLLEEDIMAVQQGSNLTRERLILIYKPFIINTVGQVCKKFVSWYDEESSIGLIAFNKAIDTYETMKGRKFLSYAYLLIKRALINYFHENKAYSSHLSLNEQREANGFISDKELEISVELYHQKLHSLELVEEIVELDQELQLYDIQFEQLEGSSPKHRDTRKMLMNIIHFYIKDSELMAELQRKRKLPMNALSRKTGYPVKTIERYRKYIITLIVMKQHPEWLHLSSFVFARDGSEGSK